MSNPIKQAFLCIAVASISMLLRLSVSELNTAVVSTEAELLAALTNDDITQINVLHDITFTQAEWDKQPRPLWVNRSVSIVGTSMEVTIDMAWLKGRLAIAPSSNKPEADRIWLEFRNMTVTRVRSPASLTMAGIDLVFNSPGSFQGFRDVFLIADACVPLAFLRVEGPKQERPSTIPNGYGNLTQYVSLWNGGWCYPDSPTRCWSQAGRLQDFGLVALAFGRTGTRVSSGVVLYSNVTYVCRSSVPMACFVPTFDLPCYRSELQKLDMLAVEQIDLSNIDSTVGTAASPGGGGGGPPLQIILPVTIAAGLAVLSVAAAVVWLCLRSRSGGWREALRSLKPGSKGCAGSAAGHLTLAGVPPSQGSSFHNSLQGSGGCGDPPEKQRTLAPGGLLTGAAATLTNESGSSWDGRPTSSPPATPKPAMNPAAAAPTNQPSARLLMRAAGSSPPVHSGAGFSPFATISTPARIVSRAGSSNVMALSSSMPAHGTGSGPAGNYPVSMGSEKTAPASGSGTAGAGGQALDAVITTTTPVDQSINMSMVLGRDLILIEEAVRGVGAFGKVVEGILKTEDGLGAGEGDGGLAGASGGSSSGSGGGRRVAVKILRGLAAATSPREMAAMRKEVEVLSRCRHANIVRLLGGNLTPPQLFLVEELMAASLDTLIHRDKGAGDLPLTQVLQIGRDVALGLAYLHPTVVHRDLKPANVLLDEQGTAKLSDFGLARLTAATLHTTSPEVGSVPYMPPECFGGGTHDVTHRADIFSLGVLLWEMVARVRPWAGEYHIKVALAVSVRGERPPLAAIEQRAPRRLCKLIEECWQEDPYRRPSALDVAKRLTVILQQLEPRSLEGPQQSPALPSADSGAAVAATAATAGVPREPDASGAAQQAVAHAEDAQVAVRQASGLGPEASEDTWVEQPPLVPTPSCQGTTPQGSGSSGQHNALAAGLNAIAEELQPSGDGPHPGPVNGREDEQQSTLREASAAAAGAPGPAAAFSLPSVNQYDSLNDSLQSSRGEGLLGIKFAMLRCHPAAVWTPPATPGSGSQGHLADARLAPGSSSDGVRTEHM